MARGAILQIMGRTVNLHPVQQLLLHHVQVTIPVHHGLLWQEVDASPANIASKTGPDHDPSRMFQGFDSVA